MKVYVACCFDRHIDPVIRVFSRLSSACKFVDWFVEQNIGTGKPRRARTLGEWRHFVEYGPEGDHAYVEVLEVDAENRDADPPHGIWKEER